MTFFTFIVSTLSTKRVPLFLDFAPLLTCCYLLLSNHYFINFVGFNFGRVYMIVETNLTQCFCTPNFKGHYLLPVFPVLKLLQGKGELSASCALGQSAQKYYDYNLTFRFAKSWKFQTIKK